MFRYQLPPTDEPDVMVLLDASHAEAFLQASGAALRMMEAKGQSQSALGILKTHHAYLLGRMEFSNNTVVESMAIDELGTKLMLPDQRANIMLLRNQLSGHIRIAMNNTMAALEAKTLHLIFYKGGPLFLIPPAQPGGRYRIALLRLQGATTMKDERCCVAVNRASRMAYRDLWGTLSEKIKEHVEEDRGSPTDVLDEAEAAPRPPASVPYLAGAKDEIDPLSEVDPDDDEEAARPTRPTNRPPGSSNGPSSADEFDMDEMSNVQF